VIKRLPAAQPITDAYEIEMYGPGPYDVWYSSQKEHLVGWLSEIDGPGYYNRQSRDWKAKDSYTHFQCAEGLLWLAEALGENPVTLRAAVEAMKAAPPRGGSQCAALRRVIPWSRIEELLRTQHPMPHELGACGQSPVDLAARKECPEADHLP